MSAVAKRFIYRGATAAQRVCRFTGEIVFVTVRINEFNQSLGIFHPVGSVFPDRYLYLRHSSPLISADIFWICSVPLPWQHAQTGRAHSLFLSDHVNQQLVAFNLDNIAEGALAAASEVQANAAFTDA